MGGKSYPALPLGSGKTGKRLLLAWEGWRGTEGGALSREVRESPFDGEVKDLDSNSDLSQAHILLRLQGSIIDDPGAKGSSDTTCRQG